MRKLNVYIRGVLAGDIVQDSFGDASFAYRPEYDGVEWSVTMPVSSHEQFGREVLLPIIAGLLPDNSEVRDSMIARVGGTYSRDNYIRLIEDYGKDLPGAVQIVPDGYDFGDAPNTYIPVTDQQIASRLEQTLSTGKKRPEWQAENERWSLGGNQGKVALMRNSVGWFSCEGAAASNVIVKPGIEDMDYQALNEAVCLRLAANVGLPAANIEYRSFDGFGAIVVERYDRLQRGDFAIERLHQEDLCQATSTMPSKKYTEDCGPSYVTIVKLLERSAGPESVDRFIDALLYNYLIGATDAHAKNYSLLHMEPGRTELAPLYDVASILPYHKGLNEITNRRKVYKTAMSIGGENRIGHLRGSVIDRFANNIGISPSETKDRIESLTLRIEGCLVETVGEFRNADGIEELAHRLVPRIESLCRATRSNLGSTAHSMTVPDLYALPPFAKTLERLGLEQGTGKRATAIPHPTEDALPYKLRITETWYAEHPEAAEQERGSIEHTPPTGRRRGPRT